MTKKIGIEYNDHALGTATVYSDEGDESALTIFPMGNQDWYMGIKDKEHPRIYPTIRCCTSGTAQPGWWGFVVAGIFWAIEGDKKRAASLFKLAADRVFD